MRTIMTSRCGRLTRGIAVGAAALALLAACGEPAADPSEPMPTVIEETPLPDPSATEPAESEPTVEPSSNLDGIEVTEGEPPEVDLETPWAVDETRTEVLTEGDGAEVQETGTVEINYLGVNARDGQTFDSSYEAGQPATFSLTQVIPGFQKGLTGQTVGSTVLIAMPGSDAYDESGGSGDGSILVGDTLIFVVEILETSLTEPAGTSQEPPSDLPPVTEVDGALTVEIPDAEPPSELTTFALIEGEGAEVTEADQITVNYVGYSWETGERIDEGSNEAAPLGSLIEGWRTGLAGQTVGSRVELVIPPELGYPEGNQQPPVVEPGDTLVYVVDILYTQSPPGS